jgi:hypothetical protein
MKIKHEDVFKYFWEVLQSDQPTAYIKYSAYIPQYKKYYHSPCGEESNNGVTLDYFQDKKYYEIPPEGE